LLLSRRKLQLLTAQNKVLISKFSADVVVGSGCDAVQEIMEAKAKPVPGMEDLTLGEAALPRLKSGQSCCCTHVPFENGVALCTTDVIDEFYFTARKSSNKAKTNAQTSSAITDPSQVKLLHLYFRNSR
jgi:hypothetical protein